MSAKTFKFQITYDTNHFGDEFTELMERLSFDDAKKEFKECLVDALGYLIDEENIVLIEAKETDINGNEGDPELLERYTEYMSTPLAKKYGKPILSDDEVYDTPVREAQRCLTCGDTHAGCCCRVANSD